MQYTIETQMPEDGKVVLSDLPFHKGDIITIIINQVPLNEAQASKYPLHGVAVFYESPFEPVAADEWSAAG